MTSPTKKDSKVWIAMLVVGILLFIVSIFWYEMTKAEGVNFWLWLLFLLSLFFIGLSFGLHAVLNQEIPRYDEVVAVVGGQDRDISRARPPYISGQVPPPQYFAATFERPQRYICPPKVDDSSPDWTASLAFAGPFNL